MLQFLAMMPSIFSAVSKVSTLFQDGRSRMEAISGKESMATTPEELQEEIRSLTPEQQAQWVEHMSARTKLYETQNDRLVLEQGTITPTLLRKLSTEAADKIAIQRQTTRPWVVRMMVHGIMFPFYLAAFDVFQQVLISYAVHPFNPDFKVFSTFTYLFGVYDQMTIAESIGNLIGSPKTLFAGMYKEFLLMASGIVIAWMGLREIGKVKGMEDHPHGDSVKDNAEGSMKTLGSLASKGLSMIDRVQKAYK